MSLINTWGFMLDKNEIVSANAETYNIGTTVKCIEENEDTVTVLYKDVEYMVLKSAFKSRETPEFNWNDNVRIIAKDKTAQIDLICWHYNEKRYFYMLISNGKKLSKRYYANELEKAH